MVVMHNYCVVSLALLLTSCNLQHVTTGNVLTSCKLQHATIGNFFASTYILGTYSGFVCFQHKSSCIMPNFIAYHETLQILSKFGYQASWFVLLEHHRVPPQCTILWSHHPPTSKFATLFLWSSSWYCPCQSPLPDWHRKLYLISYNFYGRTPLALMTFVCSTHALIPHEVKHKTKKNTQDIHGSTSITCLCLRDNNITISTVSNNRYNN